MKQLVDATPGGHFGAESGWASNGNNPVSFSTGTWYSYLIRIEQDGTYQIGASVMAGGSAQVQALVDGDPLGTWTVQSTGRVAASQTLSAPGIYLSKANAVFQI